MAKKQKTSLVVMTSARSRLPLYYSLLKQLEQEGVKTISSAAIANYLNINPVLVRKDLAGASHTSGKPKLGFEVSPLLSDLKDYLGYTNYDEAFLVGVGNLGHTLLSNRGFEDLGINIVAGFDNDPALIGQKVGDKPILPMEKMDEFVKRLGLKIGIITVPSDCAQEVCDHMVSSGVRAIWNFSFTMLNVPENVIVKNENLPMSLALLLQQMKTISE
jgi:redox-sensing transcriptional repressor